MASEEETVNLRSKGSHGTERGVERNEGSIRDRESANPEGTKEDGKDLSTGESSGKAEGSTRGSQKNKEGRDKERSSPRNSDGIIVKKAKVSDARRKLAKIEKRTAKYKAKLIEEMMAGNERDLPGEELREERRTSQGEIKHGGKDSSHKGTPSKKGKEKGDSPVVEVKKAINPPAIDSGASRLPAAPKIMKGCDGLWGLRERVLGWFDPEGTATTGEKRKDSKEGEETSTAGETGNSEGGLKKIVSILTRVLNKSQGYLADVKKKLTFDGANITEFLIDYENLASLLKWSEEEKMDHLGQHVSLSLGRDIMAIVAASGSWKETRNEMMRKYLKAEKMATKAQLAAVQRKNYATYNDFLRAFTLVALRIPGVTDRIMSKYFLRQFSKFDKDKILSSYQQTSKFEYTRDVDFITVKTVVTETLALLKEGEVIDLTGKTGDKVKKGIESLHEQVHEVDNKIERVENALLVMQAQVFRPALPPQEAVVPTAVANRGYEAEPVADIVWDQSRGRGPQVNFILESNGQDKVNITTRRARAEKKLIRDMVTEDVAGTSANQGEHETGELGKAYGKAREEELIDKATAAKKKFKYQIPILTMPEIDDTLSKLLVKAGIRESIWSFQRMTVMEEMDHDIILGRPWCANIEMIGMHLHDGTYMIDIEDPVTGRGELLQLLGTGGDPPKGKLATWSPIFEDSTRKGAFARMEGMRERVEIMIEESFSKKEWIKMGLPLKKKRQEDEVLGVMVAEKEPGVELEANLPKPKECRKETPKVTLEVPNLLQLIMPIKYHKVGVDPATLAKFEDEVQKGYCLNGKIVSIQPRVAEVARPIPTIYFSEERSQKGSVRKYKPVGKKAKPVSILVETSREEAMEKEEEILRVIRERRAAEGHRIPDEVADTIKIGIDGFLTVEETQLMRKACQEFHLAFAFNNHQKGRLDGKLISPVRIHTVEHERCNDKGSAYEFGIAAEVTELLRAKIDSFVAETTASPYANKCFFFGKPNKTLRWIQDLQKLNAVTIRDAGSLPQADLLAESHPDPAKTDKISQWPTPLRTTTEVRAFLGVVGFWRVFIKGFAKIVEPVRAMIRDGGTMEWTEDRDAAVQTLKDILSSDQVTLAAPRFNDKVTRPFILETDGGPLAVGEVLIQKSEEGRERPIRFESRTLNSTERRYSQFKKEVLAILHCLKTFQAYLFGRQFIMRIDPTNVAGALKNYKPIDPTVGRWIGFIWQFDDKVERIAGLRNRADGLSRVCITPKGTEEEEPIDAFLEYKGGTLVTDNEMMNLACTPRQLLIQTQEKGAPAVVAELKGPVTTIRRKDEKDSWEELIAMAAEGGRGAVMYILDARDNLSGYVEAVALKRKTGKGVADWVENFYLRHPFIRRFIADNGTEFVNHEVISKLKTLCVPIKIIEPYHPEANAPIERGHRTLKNTIAKLAADDLENWPRSLKQAVFAENMTPKRTTGCIPAKLWYGKEIDFPVEALASTWNRLDDNPHMSTEELITARCQ
ncbi:hypothetical protein CBR_g51306 [Chara braunii]|uniref:Integrase catalytic domain-containing protein n=1 Tax=Chara braunii TaxID=69332 RepID=A0A388M8C3_CHABU|nr:hypothetical protein CBR_g51306 [Chara braunii]|eukprot:GBG90800.1 hypothetical protein CBR_g51306 [Chara braunii]